MSIKINDLDFSTELDPKEAAAVVGGYTNNYWAIARPNSGAIYNLIRDTLRARRFIIPAQLYTDPPRFRY